MTRPLAADRLRSLATGAAVLVGALLASCRGGSPGLAAHWRDREITVDGKLQEWGGLLTTIPRTEAEVGVVNDGEALYIALGTSDPALARLIAHRGLTVWFDPAGAQHQTLGVRFPLPAAGAPSRWGETGGSQPGGAQLDNVELLGPAPYTRKQVAAPGTDGVQVAIGGVEQEVTYELRVPLATAQAWGLGVAPGATIGIGLESKGSQGSTRGRGARGGESGDSGGGDSGGEGDGGSGGDQGGQGGQGGGRGGGYGGRHGGFGRMGEGASGNSPIHDFVAWTVVHLATGPAK